MQAVDPRRPARQDTFDLREQIQSDDDSRLHAHADAASANYVSTDDEEHSVLEDDSDGEGEEYMEDDDDASSTLSIPNESIDFDLVYSLHSFAATVEGQANVVKGDSLFLMDDSNSYWWLVRVLKTQEVGYIPAENIETPFERLARLNKHRNVDLASATQAELQDGLNASQDRLRNNLNSRAGSNQSPSPIPRAAAARSRQSKSVIFTPALQVHRYPPAVWNEEEEEDEDVEWDDEGYEDEDPGLADEQMQRRREEELGPGGMEPDDGMAWEDAAAQGMQSRQIAGAPGEGTGLTREQHQQMQQQQQLQQQQLLQQQQQQHQQQQQQQIAQQQQVQQQALAQQQQVQAQAQAGQQSLRSSSSRERLTPTQDPVSRHIDPLEATETRKLTVTPTIAREFDDRSSSKGPLLPSAILEKQQEEERIKRQREEETEEARKKVKGKEKMAAPVSSANLAQAPKPNGGSKLRKEPQREAVEEDNGKKKKGGVFGSLFNRKKERGRDKNASIGSLESGDLAGRTSEDSSRSGHTRPSVSTMEGVVSPNTASAMQQQQQQQQQQTPPRNSTDPKQIQEPSFTPSTPPQVSQHASQLRQRDQQQQALYQQYLNRSPSSPPEAQPSYGLQSAPVIMGPSSYHGPAGLGPPNAPRPRPGSLILTPSSTDGQGPGVPELSVIRVFAGKNLQTEATFKTVLLNSSTTSADLVRQAIQRFRLSAGEEENDYYLTVKQVEGGSSAVLLPSEKPLGVFETLVVEAEMPKVKRSSVGSISSVASNLSMHPAIKKLPMNDFTDDSAVKFYLNRRGDDGLDDSLNGHEGDDTLVADTSHGESDIHVPRQFLSVSTTHASNVTPERFTSPSFRFALQLVIYPDDLPEDMVFHPFTEAIVFKDTLRESDASTSSSVSQSFRRKVFVFPKNVTVAEVIELGLERFGIQEGVVDGGDEVEDKTTKRRSSTRVRYGLTVDTGIQERELSPSSRVIDAFLRPPAYRPADRQSNNKRRSVDSAQLLGTLEDVNADDPVFILRRAISYRTSTTRHRISTGLDEIALQHLHRESASSMSSDPPSGLADDSKQKPLSRQEIIAAQRAATRANQRAILSTQVNSVRGLDVLLPGNAMLRSSRYDSDRMRYSYVQPDGETYDISDIVEEEWRESNPANKNDLLAGLVRKDGVGEKLDRVLSKIRHGKPALQERDLASQSSLDSHASSLRSASPSEYSMDESSGIEAQSRSRSVTPGSAGIGRSTSPSKTDDNKSGRPGTTTPTGKPSQGANRRHPSIASVMSDISGYATPAATTSPMTETSRTVSTPKPQQKRLFMPKDEFGVSHMMAIIEYKSSQPKVPLPPLDPVDELLFGRPTDLETLHPHIRDIYAGAFKQLDDMDKVLDEYLVGNC